MGGKFIALAFAIFALAGNAAAEGIQAQCGDESGRAFAVAQGVIRADQAGWYDDATHGETVIRIDTNTGEAEVRYKDATGIWQSVSDQGGSATLFGAQSEPITFTVLVAYPGRTIEVLTIAEHSARSRHVDPQLVARDACAHECARDDGFLPNNSLLIIQPVPIRCNACKLERAAPRRITSLRSRPNSYCKMPWSGSGLDGENC